MISPARRAFLEQSFGPVIMTGLKADRTLIYHKLQTPADAIAALMSCDPTTDHKDKAGRYMTWLCRTYAYEWAQAQKDRRDHAMLAEDFKRIHDYLDEFDRKKIHLPREQRDINRLSFDDLKEIVIGMRERKVETSSEHRAYIDAQTTILYEGPKGKIVVPHSIESSCFWGLNTEWCTAATKADNKFHEYNLTGPLAILIPPGNSRKRYQAHNECNLMDQNDKAVSTIDASL